VHIYQLFTDTTSMPTRNVRLFNIYKNKSRAIAGTTARCAQYMSAQIIM